MASLRGLELRLQRIEALLQALLEAVQESQDEGASEAPAKTLDGDDAGALRLPGQSLG